MGVILKLLTKNDATILSIRPENNWARKYFSDILQIRQGQNNTEIAYAEVPAKNPLIVKVAFKNYEESLIQEARSLEKIALDEETVDSIIGMIQHGRLQAMNSSSADDRLGYYIMMEYASRGSAEQLYKKFPQTRLNTAVAFYILYWMTQALVKLKQKQIIHRDIKPQNILFDQNFTPKLSDFGLAITTEQKDDTLNEDRRRLLKLLDSKFLQVSSKKDQAEIRLKNLVTKSNALMREKKIEELQEIRKEINKVEKILTDLEKQEKERAEAFQDKYRLVSAEENALKGQFAGSLFYAAPEQFEPDTILSPKCDVYQLGAVMYTLFTGFRPVTGDTIPEAVTQVLHSKTPEVKKILKSNDELLIKISDLITRMMWKDQQKRIKIEELKEEIDKILFTFYSKLMEKVNFELPDKIKEDAAKKKCEENISFAQSVNNKCRKMLFHLVNNNKEKFNFKCPNCNRKLHIYMYMAGKATGNCPSCKNPIHIDLWAEDKRRAQNGR